MIWNSEILEKVDSLWTSPLYQGFTVLPSFTIFLITGHDYRTARMLMKHYFRDHGAIPPMLENKEQFMCSLCPNIYTNKRSLASHVKYKHSEIPNISPKKQAQVECPHCKKTYSGNVALKNHIILKHDRNAQHRCDLCQVNS